MAALTRSRSTPWATWWAATTAASPGPRYLLTGSHYDTVRNGGKYDGAWASSCPWPACASAGRAGKRLPFGIEVVGLPKKKASATRPPSSESRRADRATSTPRGWSRRTPTASPCATPCSTPACAWTTSQAATRPGQYLGFVEVHIEQGPVLNELDMPLGIVTSINGSVRYQCEMITGMASHAGTTPMDRRRDAAAAVAELALYVEQRAAQDGDSVGTIGLLNVPNGSINVVPGAASSAGSARAHRPAARCPGGRRAGRAAGICNAACAATPGGNHARRRAQRARPGSTLGTRAGKPWACRLFRMPSGAGHDAMKLHEIMPQAMLFVRGRTPASATTRWNHHQRRHVAGRRCLPALLTNWPKKPPNPPHEHHLRTTGRLDRPSISTSRCVFCRPGARAHRHAPGNNAPTPNARPRTAAGHGLLTAEKACRAPGRGAGRGMESITNLIVRRPYGSGGKAPWR